MILIDWLAVAAAVLVAVVVVAGIADAELRYRLDAQLRIWLYRLRRRWHRWRIERDR